MTYDVLVYASVGGGIAAFAAGWIGGALRTDSRLRKRVESYKADAAVARQIACTDPFPGLGDAGRVLADQSRVIQIEQLKSQLATAEHNQRVAENAHAAETEKARRLQTEVDSLQAERERRLAPLRAANEKRHRDFVLRTEQNVANVNAAIEVDMDA